MSTGKAHNPYPITVTDCKTGRKEKVKFSLRILVSKDYIEAIGGYGSSVVLNGFDGLPLPIASIEEIGERDNFEVTLGSAYVFIESSLCDPQYSHTSNDSPKLEDIKASISACHTWLHKASKAANNGEMEKAKYWISAVMHRLLPYNEESNDR
jgi:hypothetical protein